MIKRESLINYSFILILQAFGIAISLYYGRLGYMPFDQSITFDGGWRILSGQIPFKDFTTPAGLVPIMLQALFFRILGINWFTYCLHAAIFNGLFCIIVHNLLKSFGGGRLISFYYALLSGIVFYPPFGVPYMDLHAIFFTLLTILIAVKASMAGTYRIRAFFLFILPVVFTLSYLSKQIPTLFAVPLIVLILFSSKEQKIWQSYRPLAYGSLFAASCLFALSTIYSLDYGLISLYFIKLPLRTGVERIFDLDMQAWAALPFNLINPDGGWILLSPILVYLVGCILLVVYLRDFFHARSGLTRSYELPLKVLIGLSLIIICSLFVQITNNEKQDGMAYIFAGLGLIHMAAMEFAGPNSRFHLPAWFLRKRRPVLIFITAMFMLVGLRDAYLFNIHVNKTRVVHNMKFTGDNLTEKSNLPRELDFMVFHLPEDFYDYTDTDLLNLTQFLKNSPDNFLLLGDTSILYGLTKKPSVAPSLWFHPGLTMPDPTSPDFKPYEKQLLSNMGKYGVRYIVLEKGAWATNELKTFTRLNIMMSMHACPPISFGSYQVIELCR